MWKLILALIVGIELNANYGDECIKYLDQVSIYSKNLADYIDNDMYNYVCATVETTMYYQILVKQECKAISPTISKNMEEQIKKGKLIKESCKKMGLLK